MNVNIKKFIKKLSQINKSAMELVENYIKEYGIEDTKELIDYSYKVVQKYGNANGAVAAAMYDAIADLEGVVLPSAEIASLPEYGEVAKTVNGILKTSQNSEEISGGVARLVKRTGQDTMLQNGIRDRAEYAWIPVGETCAFCITLASRGWQPMSKEALKGGHAEHIHSNCDCTYMIRHSSDFDVEGYDPQEYKDMYYNAPLKEGQRATAKNRINALRREFYAKNKAEINAQKRIAYASKAEETIFNAQNKFGKIISFERPESTNERVQKLRQEQENIIKELSNQYETRLETVKSGAHQAAGDVDITGQVMRLNSAKIEDAIHEFAHTLTNTDSDKAGLTDDKEFWNEIRKIRTSYRKAVKDDYQKQISVYADSQNILDEFMAEAFVQGKAKELGIKLPDKYGKDYTYSNMVLEVINKYFKRK